MPRISKVEQQEDDVSQTSSVPAEHPQKKTLAQLADELKKLKIPDLVKLLEELTEHQLSVPKKPRRPDLTSRITEVAIAGEVNLHHCERQKLISRLTILLIHR